MRLIQKYTFLRTFNLCFFAGICLLAIYPDSLNIFLKNATLKYGAAPLLNGSIIALFCIAVNKIWSRTVRKSLAAYHTIQLGATAFIAGIACIYAAYSVIAAYAVGLFILYLSYINIRRFFRNIAKLLLPENEASKTQIRQFINFYINLLISYSVINLMVNMLHISFHTAPAFNFGKGISAPLDAVYFSIMTLTTIGYADIMPQNNLGRLLTGLECLVGYFVMALMLGIVLKGIRITPRKN